MKEQTILKRLRAGDQQALEEIYSDYYERLLFFGIRLTSDQEVARELIQDLFTHLWQQHTTLNIHTSVKTYLFSSIYNRSMKWIRHRKIEELYSKEKQLEHIPAPLPNSQEEPGLKRAIFEAIDELPDKSRLVFQLTQLDGLSYAETAGKLGISIKTVENLLSRARKRLQSKLKKYR